MGPIRCPETSVKDYHSTLRNILEEHRSHLHSGGSMKIRIPYFDRATFESLLKIKQMLHVSIIELGSLQYVIIRYTVKIIQILWISDISL
jgi:hypothetical protein